MYEYLGTMLIGAVGIMFLILKTCLGTGRSKQEETRTTGERRSPVTPIPIYEEDELTAIPGTSESTVIDKAASSDPLLKWYDER
jgi:hypothetical protein